MSSTTARPAVARHAARRLAAAALTSALLVLGATACNSKDDGVKTAPDKASSKPAAAPAPASGTPTTAKAQPKAAAVGDTLTLTGMEGAKDAVTVVKVVATAQGADDMSQPDAGKRFYAVQFRIKNLGKAAYRDTPSNGAKVVDSQGQAYEADYNDTKAGQSFPSDVAIAPGDTSLGFVTFQVPKNAKIVKIQFGLDSGYADQTGQWAVN